MRRACPIWRSSSHARCASGRARRSGLISIAKRSRCDISDFGDVAVTDELHDNALRSTARRTMTSATHFGPNHFLRRNGWVARRNDSRQIRVRDGQAIPRQVARSAIVAGRAHADRFRRRRSNVNTTPRAAVLLRSRHRGLEDVSARIDIPGGSPAGAKSCGRPFCYALGARPGPMGIGAARPQAKRK